MLRDIFDKLVLNIPQPHPVNTFHLDAGIQPAGAQRSKNIFLDVSPKTKLSNEAPTFHFIEGLVSIEQDVFPAEQSGYE